jgi:iron complex transport system substrate-binding protein
MTHRLTEPHLKSEHSQAQRVQLTATRRHAMGIVGTSLAGSAAAISTLAYSQTQTTDDASARPRLVTLGGAITEIAYLLGMDGQIVGTDTTSTFPEAALRTPKVGYMRQLSAEGLLSLRPQALIATTEAGPPVVIDQVRSAGVKVELVEADHTWAQVQRQVQAVGRAGARQAQAQQLQAQLDAQWRQTQALVARASGRKPRVLYILAHAQSPSVSGEKTAANALIQAIGATNAMQGFNGYRPMTAESMAQAAPDVILTSTQSVQAQGGEEKFWDRAELQLTPAFKRKALVHMDSLRMLGFGPRLPATVAELHPKVVLT